MFCLQKSLALGTFPTVQQAALAYDLAAVLWKGRNARTNYSLGLYEPEIQDRDVKGKVWYPFIPVMYHWTSVVINQSAMSAMYAGDHGCSQGGVANDFRGARAKLVSSTNHT
jgi:hypothetical protein